MYFSLQSKKVWYELSEATRLQSGTLYPILMRLADQGLLASQW
jgi:PadR family transcriptional regulator PadR